MGKQKTSIRGQLLNVLGDMRRLEDFLREIIATVEVEESGIEPRDPDEPPTPPWMEKKTDEI